MAYYFASDVHLGLSFRGDDPLERERCFVRWLDRIEADCEGLFLVGDIFDFWFEYKRVIPKGFTRLLGKLSEMTDRGIPVHFFAGNHDYWVRDYFEREIGMQIHLEPVVFDLKEKRVFVAHGDGLGKINDWKYKAMQSVFRSRFWRRVAEVLVPPNQMMRLGYWWSSKNRHGRKEGVSHGFREENEPIVTFARAYEAENGEMPDYFVCGHIHTPVLYPLEEKSSLVVLGEWIEEPAVAKMGNDGKIELEFVND